MVVRCNKELIDWDLDGLNMFRLLYILLPIDGFRSWKAEIGGSHVFLSLSIYLWELNFSTAWCSTNHWWENGPRVVGHTWNGHVKWLIFGWLHIGSQLAQHRLSEMGTYVSYDWQCRFNTAPQKMEFRVTNLSLPVDLPLVWFRCLLGRFINDIAMQVSQLTSVHQSSPRQVWPARATLPWHSAQWRFMWRRPPFRIIGRFVHPNFPFRMSRKQFRIPHLNNRPTFKSNNFQSFSGSESSVTSMLWVFGDFPFPFL